MGVNSPKKLERNGIPFYIPSEDNPPGVQKYYEELQRDGPYAITSPAGSLLTLGICLMPDAEFHNSKFLEVVKFTVNEHNAHCQLVEDQSLELVRVVKVNYRLLRSGTTYYITLEAMNNAKIMNQFQTTVVVCDAGCKALLEFNVVPGGTDNTCTGSLSDEEADDEFWNEFFRRHAPEAICENENDPKEKFCNPRYKTVCRRTYAEEKTCYHDLCCDPGNPGLPCSPYHLLKPSSKAFVPDYKADEEFISKIQAENSSVSGSNGRKHHVSAQDSCCYRTLLSDIMPRSTATTSVTGKTSAAEQCHFT